MASSDGVRVGCDMERCSDKVSALNHLRVKAKECKEGQAKGRAERWAGGCLWHKGGFIRGLYW